MHTERFRQLRKEALSGLLDKKSVAKVWRRIVKDQLRSIEIRDLFDHYDFNYNIEDRATALKSSILEGTYTVSTPLIYRIEKKYGVCRHLIIPQPIDALLLQVLAESVADRIIAKQPSPNSFYSRDKHNVKKPHEDLEYGLSFREQWKKLQKKIYKFNEDKNLLIVTDLSNYFDSIHLDELRKVFVSLVEANEVIVDLLFKVIEGISWTPDYLPYSKRGLPTANVEAIRLLAHSFLFEIDDVIKRKTNNSFARWMDDITIGVDTKRDAITLLSSISDMLKSRGLALNLSKTAILDSADAQHHFQIDENQYLDSIDSISTGTSEAVTVEKQLKTRFRIHFKDKSAKYWEKVTKRYITAFGRLRSKWLVKQLPSLYLDYPGLRPNLLIYMGNIGYSKGSASAVQDILKKISIFDDLSLFQISNLLTTWEIPDTASGHRWIKIFDQLITNHSFAQKEPIGFHSVMWFKSKYSNPSELLSFLRKYDNLWQSHSFLRRQATVCFSRLLSMKLQTPRNMLTHQALSGIPSTVSVANQISLFSRLRSFEPKIRLYLFPTIRPKVYPHAKFLVLCAVLNSPHMRTDLLVLDGIRTHITDPVYRKWIVLQYDISI